MMDSEDDTDSYYCGCGIIAGSIGTISSSAEMKVEESVDDSGDEEYDGVYPIIAVFQRNYTILKVEDMMKRQNGYIESISDVLALPKWEAISLLCYYDWNVDRIQEEWFLDQQRVRESVGILDYSSTKRPCFPETVLCDICCEYFRRDQMRWVSCGHHPFCCQCWKTYISMSIENKGIGCLRLKCPEPSCPAIVGLDTISNLGSESDHKRVLDYLFQSYVEGSKNRKWCPAPGCVNAVEYEAGVAESYDVTCDCGHKFCWSCTEEAHRPLDCEMVAKWYEKNHNESENMTWINAFTKPCPKCRRRIEKNQGCNHMICRPPCGFEFCWSCLGSWDRHGGSLYDCNRYTEAMSEEDRNRDIVKKDLARYAHYYERWASNDMSKKVALADLNLARKGHVYGLGRIQGEPDGGLAFVIEAWEQIVECRRVLKWSYAYAYLILEDGSAKMGLFQHLQGQAERTLERLHHCAEMELTDKYLRPKASSSSGPFGDFYDFRSKMTNLTTVAKNHFQKLVAALEDNLSEVTHIR